MRMKKGRDSRKKVFLILHNIRSVYNVGSIFRTADAAGVAKIYLTGYTPAPLDRFGKTRKDLAKVALVAEKMVPWEHCLKIKTLLQRLRKENIKIAALEQAENSINYKTFKLTRPTALILGNEVSGIEKNVLKLCDRTIQIPMRGKKESLNVSVATGIALFRILNR